MKLSSKVINIITLNIDSLRHSGLYRRTPHINSTCWGEEKDNVMRDSVDKKPFSTQFSFSRFLVPFLNGHEGWALFMDCDMYFRSDPIELFEKYIDDSKAVMVVKHNQKEKDGNKMYGCPQTSYSRKNWSSFIVFNCEHPSNKKLSVDVVNSEPGSFLHQFKWLSDDEIGSLDERWNWLEGWTSNSNKAFPYAVHYTRGGPWFDEWQDVEFAEEWLQERDLYLKNKFILQD